MGGGRERGGERQRGPSSFFFFAERENERSGVTSAFLSAESYVGMCMCVCVHGVLVCVYMCVSRQRRSRGQPSTQARTHVLGGDGGEGLRV